MKLSLHKSFYLLIITLIMAAGCKKEYESIEEIDERGVQAYIKENNLTVQEYNNTGIYYQIITPGTGLKDIEYTDKIFATFTAKSLDGEFSMQADSLNRFSSFLGYFSVSNGYPEAFATAIKEILKKKGGTIRLIIPSHLAYGRSGNSNLDIPGNASLDCTIKVYDVNNQTEFEDVFVKRYIAANNIQGLTRLPSGLYYQRIIPGTGTVKVNETSTVTVSYVGKLTNGTVFDESTSYKEELYQLIPGWQEGLTQPNSPITKGAKVRLIIPPFLGYGSNEGSIPAYSILDFTIEILEVE